jgi:hypothetical protein
MAYKTNIQGIITEAMAQEYDDIAKVKKIYEEMKKEAIKLRKHFLVKLENPSVEKLNKGVIAVDGSSFQEQYESIAITMATAFVYTNKQQTEKYLPKIKMVPPYYSNIVNSIRMKNLEYLVAKTALEEFETKDDNIDLVMLDGAITFPDEAIGEYLDNVKWVKDVYDEHLNIVNDFFDYVIDRDIPTISVVKDSMANKYFLSLYSILKNPQTSIELDYDFLIKNKTFFDNWGKDGEFNFISEKSMIKHIFGNHEFYRTKYTEVTCCLRNEIPAKKLKGNVMGFYFKTVNNQRPFFVEVPMQFKNKIDEITSMLSSFSYYSLRMGYPFPLYAAHKQVELNKNYARNISRILKNIAIKKIRDRDLFNEQFHDTL